MESFNFLKIEFKNWLLKQEDFGQGSGPTGSGSFWHGESGIKKRKKKILLPLPKVDNSKQGIQGTSRDEGSA
jgi:hypothetical protein